MTDVLEDVIESETDCFEDLVSVSQLRPETDFVGADLAGVDFGKADLRSYRFDKAILDQANLSAVRLSRRTLEGASCVGARLPRSTPGLGMRRITVAVPTEVRLELKARFGAFRNLAIDVLLTLKGVPPHVLEDSIVFVESVRYDQLGPQARVSVSLLPPEKDILDVIFKDTDLSSRRALAFILILAFDAIELAGGGGRGRHHRDRDGRHHLIGQDKGRVVTKSYAALAEFVAQRILR